METFNIILAVIQAILVVAIPAYINFRAKREDKRPELQKIIEDRIKADFARSDKRADEAEAREQTLKKRLTELEKLVDKLQDQAEAQNAVIAEHLKRINKLERYIKTRLGTGALAEVNELDTKP